MDDLETRLQRYRAVGPPPDLRDRIARAADASRPLRAREWLPALAAAALATTFVFYVLAAGVRSQLVEAQMAPIREQREVVLRQLAASLGGDVHAQEEAERLLWLDEHASRGLAAPVPELELEKRP